MLEMEQPNSSKPTTAPQLSEMFQKFAIAFKSKTYEFFAEDGDADTAAEDDDPFTLLDSAEDFIPDQKVIIIKPDNTSAKQPDPVVAVPPTTRFFPSPPSIQPFNPQFAHYLISLTSAIISSFEASYLQLQTAHVPFNEESIKSNDKALISQLQKLGELRQLYIDSRRNPNFFQADFVMGSCFEAQVQENQNKLRSLETMFNRLQSDIDEKDSKVSVLRSKLKEVQVYNSKLSKKDSKSKTNFPLLTVRVFDSMLLDTCKALRRFTKLLVDLMEKAGWDLEFAANFVHPNVEYAKKGHKLYAFLSYICLGMFKDFDSESFGLAGNETGRGGDRPIMGRDDALKQLIEHVSNSPVDVLNRNPSCEFTRFCERKYEQLIHPSMESSIFRKLDRKEAVLDSWRSLSVFYEAFVKMSSSVWVLHKLAFCFDPVVEIFQVEKGVDFSMVYMEDATRRGILPRKSRPKVGFTVVPGFKIGKTVIQSQVYLTGMECTDSKHVAVLWGE